MSCCRRPVAPRPTNTGRCPCGQDLVEGIREGITAASRLQRRGQHREVLAITCRCGRVNRVPVVYSKR